MLSSLRFASPPLFPPFSAAQKALGDFFQQPDALERLGRLYADTLEGVERAVDTSRPVDYAHSVLDLAVQKIVGDLSWRLLTEPDATPESVGVPQLVDLCVQGVEGEFLINSAPYKVLEDLMEGQTIGTCEKLWGVLETRKQKLTSKHFIAQGPGRTTKASLCLLRMCNALLRRLSKTHNSVFCGKILLFLSFTFSLSERSAVNLTGKVGPFALYIREAMLTKARALTIQVNASNVTAFEDHDAFEAAEAADIDKEGASGEGLEVYIMGIFLSLRLNEGLHSFVARNVHRSTRAQLPSLARSTTTCTEPSGASSGSCASASLAQRTAKSLYVHCVARYIAFRVFIIFCLRKTRFTVPGTECGSRRI